MATTSILKADGAARAAWPAPANDTLPSRDLRLVWATHPPCRSTFPGIPDWRPAPAGPYPCHTNTRPTRLAFNGAKRVALAVGLLAALSSPFGRAVAREAPTASPPDAPAACAESSDCARREGYGNVCVDNCCRPYVDRMDITDVFRGKPSETPKPEEFRLYPAIIPAIGYNPALGFLIGVVGKFGMYLGDPAETTMSSGSALVLLTTKQQLVIQLGSTVMTARNDWELQGDWRLLLYNQDTYGLGTGVPLVKTSFSINGWGGTTPIDGAQPMKFDLLRFHETVLKRAWGSLYVGGGYLLDRYFSIDDESLDLSTSSPVITSHYAYSKYYGFNPNEYTVSGVSADVLFDSRDSTISAYKGFYAHLSFAGLPTWLGSSQGSTMVGADLRAYVGLSDAVPRNVLAFWVLASGVTSGHQPYLTLPSIGWDAAGTTGRGYIQGRYRGTAEVYAEAEWRFPVTSNGLFGGAVFANAETFSRPAFSYSTLNEPATYLFQYVRPAVGFGARVLLSKESRANLRVDFAWGADSFCVYLGAGEAF